MIIVNYLRYKRKTVTLQRGGTIKSLPQRLNIDELLLIYPFNDSRGGVMGMGVGMSLVSHILLDQAKGSHKWRAKQSVQVYLIA